MAKINNTHELAKFLQEQANFLGEYSAPFAKELNGIAASFLEMDLTEIKELKKIPKIIEKAQEKEDKAKEQVDKLKEQLATEKEKSKEQQETLKNQVQAEKDKAKEQLAAEKEKAKEQQDKLKEQLSAEKSKTKEQQDKAKEQLAAEKEKAKEQQDKLKQKVQEEKDKAKEQVEKLKLQIEEIKGKSREKTSRKKNSKSGSKDKPDLYTNVELSDFHGKLAIFQRKSHNLAKDFPEKGWVTLDEISRLGDEFIEKQESLEERLAASLAKMIECGGLQSMSDGKIWRDHGLGFYSISSEAERALQENELSTEQIQKLFLLVRVGLPNLKSKKDLVTALIKGVTMRAYARGQ